MEAEPPAPSRDTQNFSSREPLPMGATPLQLPLAGAQKLQQQLLPFLHGRRSELQQPLLQPRHGLRLGVLPACVLLRSAHGAC